MIPAATAALSDSAPPVGWRGMLTRLVSSISYYAPTGVTGTPGVSFTYDAAGRELACKDKTGLWTTLAIDPHYILRHNADTGIYWAGCREFTAEQALDHWSVRDDARAMQFTAAIINHLGETE